MLGVTEPESACLPLRRRGRQRQPNLWPARLTFESARPPATSGLSLTGHKLISQTSGLLSKLTSI
jgi:hypothetical protein